MSLKARRAQVDVRNEDICEPSLRTVVFSSYPDHRKSRMHSTTPEQLGSVRRRIATGEYRVDSERVASAMLEKIGAMAIRRELSARAGHIRPVEVNGRRAA